MVQYGKIRLDNLIWLELSLLILLPFYTYYMAVNKDHIPPFPHTTVTHTARPYPQNIAFRFGMLTAASFLALTFFCMFKWLKYVKIRSQWPGHIPNVAYSFAEFLIFPFCIIIGTIDSGFKTLLHDVASVIFFIGLLGLTIYITSKLWVMKKWDASIISRESWFLKRLTCFYLIAVWIYCIYGFLTPQKIPNHDFIVIVEWNTVTVNLLWLLSFRREWKKVYLTFDGQGGDLFQLVE